MDSKDSSENFNDPININDQLSWTAIVDSYDQRTNSLYFKVSIWKEETLTEIINTETYPNLSYNRAEIQKELHDTILKHLNKL